MCNLSHFFILFIASNKYNVKRKETLPYKVKKKFYKILQTIHATKYICPTEGHCQQTAVFLFCILFFHGKTSVISFIFAEYSQDKLTLSSLWLWFMSILKESPPLLLHLTSWNCWKQNILQRRNDRTGIAEWRPHKFPSLSKSWEQKCQRIQTPWRRKQLLGWKGIWRSGFSQIEYHSSHRRGGRIQLQALTSES